uniref:Uncharacterized protein n=1 Tax=Macrostomum lignano TaxID=282301 RepID=A0A1I8FD64_9PLAT
MQQQEMLLLQSHSFQQRSQPLLALSRTSSFRLSPSSRRQFNIQAHSRSAADEMHSRVSDCSSTSAAAAMDELLARQNRSASDCRSRLCLRNPSKLPNPLHRCRRSMAGTKRSYRFVRRATGDDDGDADGRVPDEGEAALLQLRGNWERQNRLLHDTRLQGAATAALTVPVPTSRYYRQSVSEMAYGDTAGWRPASRGATSYRTQLLDRREQNNQLKDAFRGRIDRLNNNREVMLQEREALREQRRQFDRRPLSPPFVDDTLPKTFQYRWEKIGSRVPTPGASGGNSPTDSPTARSRGGPSPTPPTRASPDVGNSCDGLTRGELGIDTYEPWQLPAYYACRQIVLDEVERVLDLVLGERHESIEALNRDTQAAVWSGAVQLVCEELLLEVTGELGQLAGREFLYLKGLAANLADQSCMRQAEAAIAFCQRRSRPVRLSTKSGRRRQTGSWFRQLQRPKAFAGRRA